MFFEASKSAMCYINKSKSHLKKQDILTSNWSYINLINGFSAVKAFQQNEWPCYKNTTTKNQSKH